MSIHTLRKDSDGCSFRVEHEALDDTMEAQIQVDVNGMNDEYS